MLKCSITHHLIKRSTITFTCGNDNHLRIFGTRPAKSQLKVSNASFSSYVDGVSESLSVLFESKKLVRAAFCMLLLIQLRRMRHTWF